MCKSFINENMTIVGMIRMNVVLCEYAEKREFTAGNKARTDTVRILKSQGYKHIPLFRSKSKKIIVLLQMMWGSIRSIISANKDDVIFLQYPYYPSIVNKTLFRVLRIGRALKKYKIELLLHDVVGLRSGPNAGQVLSQEVNEFNSLDKVICHNDKMRSALKDAGCSVELAILGPFDYLVEKSKIPSIKSERDGGEAVVIAGNLSEEKCGYVYKLNELSNVEFRLYGIGYTGKSDDKITYEGKFDPEELVKVLKGNFGLVWDGDSLETCDGVYGNYLKYNNPHKFSLYLVAGIPLIVWNQSALADHVRRYNLGICIESLYELNDLNINPEIYKGMKKSVAVYRDELIRGSHLVKALNM